MTLNMTQRLLAIGIGIAVLIGISCTSVQNGISGKITGAGGKTIYLHRLVNNKLVATDSTVAGADGEFNLVPSDPLSLDIYWLVVTPQEALILITDSNENLEVKADLADLNGTARVNGSVQTETLRELELDCAPLNKKFEETALRLSNPELSMEERAQLKHEITEGKQKRTEIIKKWLSSNSSSLASLIAVQKLDPKADAAEFVKVFNALEKPYGRNAMYKALRQQVQMMNQQQKAEPDTNPNSPTAIGKTAPEIALADTKGKVRKLSDLRGKTVLIDFWASWCGPCRRENPNVVAAYNKYNKDGFEVFSVSLDRSKQPWIDAIAKDGLIWPNHVSDLKHWDSEAARLYGISSIPKTYLLDKDGKIIGSDLRGPALEAKLQAIYGH